MVKQQLVTWDARAAALMAWGLRHWLFGVNTAVLIYGGLPWLAPLLRLTGHHALGVALFLAYAPLCHQLPERSFLLGGYQLGFCQRETALFTVLLAGGLAFSQQRHVRPPPLWLGALLLLPLLLDGGSHALDDLLGLHSRGSDLVGSPSYWLRLTTGALAAIGLLLSVYPRLERDLCLTDDRRLMTDDPG